VKPRAVFFDLETGGVEPQHPDIQLAAIAVDEETWTELETFERKIAFNPDDAVLEALQINHYSPEAWKDAAPRRLVLSQFVQFLDRHRSVRLVSHRTGRAYMAAKLIGHNAATFDGPRLIRAAKAESFWLPIDLRVRDTMQRAMWWFDENRLELSRLAPPAGDGPRDFKLTTLCQYFGIPIEGAHEALTDVRLTIALARALSSPIRQEVTS
jgi:DNA polymerase III epsilon subunit-like protein